MRKITRRVPATTNNLTKAIVNFLNDRGHYAFRVNNGAVFDPKFGGFRRRSDKDPAISDVICILKGGETMLIEVKNAHTGDKPSTKQVEFRDEVLLRGAYHHFAKTYDGFLSYYKDHFGA